MPEARKIAIPIRYHTQYGTVPSATTGFNGCPLEEKHLPVLTYEGYKFIGWYYDEAFTQEAKVGDIVGHSFYLYAKWVEVPTVKSKMTAIADEIRELSGTTGTMGLDAMATHIGDANGEISTQTDLLAQIASALEGKTAGGSGGASVETCTGRVAYTDMLNVKNPFTPPCYYTGDNLSTKTFNANGGGTSITAIKGSLLYVADTRGGTVGKCENATLILSTSTGKLFSIDADEFRVSIDDGL